MKAELYASEIPASKAYDVIVIGAGHNGLVTAATLARAGLSVLVVERRAYVGGAASTEEIFPGFQVNTGAMDAGLFLPEIASELGLERHGLRWLEGPALAFAPQMDGNALTLWRDPQRTAGEIERLSKSDAEKYPAFVRLVSRLAAVLRTLMTMPPPDLPSTRWSELLPWWSVALQLKRLGDRDMMEFLRLLPMPVEDFLDEWFESPALKGALGASGVSGSLLGPKASGTAFMHLYQAVNAGAAGVRASRFVQGGTGRLSEALASAARERGAEICTGLGVQQITVQEGRVTGVILENGHSVSARAVASSADPRHTFFDLVGAPNLEVRHVREVKNIRLRASTARVNLVLSGLPHFNGAAGSDMKDRLSGHVLICPSLEYLERAYDDAKYGAFSRQPYLDAAIPTILDPALAQPGQHLMTINVQYTPFVLKDGGWDEQKTGLVETVLTTLESYAPGIREQVTQVQAITPLDLQREYGLSNGDIYHGQMGLDQLLFMRPFPGSSGYATRQVKNTWLGNLFLCGAGAHPGGGVTGAPGYNAAMTIIQQITG